MAEQSSLSLPLRILLRAALNVALVYAMDRFLPQYFTVFGGWPAYIVVGAVITVLNFVVRPLLDIVTLPLSVSLMAVLAPMRWLLGPRH